MSHLVVTLGILGLYAYTLVSGHPDTTLQTILVTIIGYWFGVLGNTMLTKNNQNKDGENK